MKLYLEEKACITQQSIDTKQLTPAKLHQLRKSIARTEKEIGQVRRMANHLQNMHNAIY